MLNPYIFVFSSVLGLLFQIHLTEGSDHPLFSIYGQLCLIFCISSRFMALWCSCSLILRTLPVSGRALKYWIYERNFIYYSHYDEYIFFLNLSRTTNMCIWKPRVSMALNDFIVTHKSSIIFLRERRLGSVFHASCMFSNVLWHASLAEAWFSTLTIADCLPWRSCSFLFCSFFSVMRSGKRCCQARSLLLWRNCFLDLS